MPSIIDRFSIFASKSIGRSFYAASMDVHERIRKGREGLKLTEERFAELCGVSRGSVQQWERGATAPSRRHQPAVAKALGISVAELMSGEEMPERNEQGDLVINQYQTGGAMGSGGLVLEEKQPGLIKSWRVDPEWIRLNVPVHTGLQNLCIVTGFGPSMKPKYNPGDPLLMDRGVSTVETEGIYFFRVENHGFIKQLQRIPTEDGIVIRAKSLNPSYDPFDITKKMMAAGQFEVFGKILTVWKSDQV